MTPEQQIQDLEARVKKLERLLTYRGNLIVLSKNVQIDGKIYSDRVYTQRSGSYVELTT